MIDFSLTEDQRLMRDTVAQFARSTLAPRAREFEKLRAVPTDVQGLAHELGLGLLALPEAAGGQGLGMLTAVLLEEELGAADAGAAFALGGPGAFGRAVVELAAAEQAAALLADFAASDGAARFGAVAWSEAKPNPARPGFACTATPKEQTFCLRGHKAFVVNAHLADRFLVFAQVDEAAGWGGIGAFVVPYDAVGFSVGARHHTLGLDAADFGDLTLDDVRVPAAARLCPGIGEAFTMACLRFFTKHGLIVAARAVGLARRAYEIAVEHCDTRIAFGKPIGHFQAVAFGLADRHMDIESARWLLWRAAAAWDGKQPDTQALVFSAQAIAQAFDSTMRTTDDCVSLHGGSGFIRDLIAEKLMRDAKQLALCGPTTAQLDQLASALALGIALDPALVLPTPDTQAIFT